jgi:ribosomal protein S18
VKEMTVSGRDDRGMDKDGDDRGRKGGSGFTRKKVCRFSAPETKISSWTIKIFGMSAVLCNGAREKLCHGEFPEIALTHQRQLTTAVKRARNLALVGYVSMGT